MKDAAEMVPLYRRVLGADFERLPPAVRALHDLRQPTMWRGRVDVQRGTAFICGIIAAIAGLPPAGPDQPLTVTFTPRNGEEIWHRAFGTAVFLTRQAPGAGGIHEFAGPARLLLQPRVSADGMSLDLTGVRLLGVPVPRFLVPKVETREFEKAGRYHFEVEARLPWFGRLVRYAGWLEPAEKP